MKTLMTVFLVVLTLLSVPAACFPQESSQGLNQESSHGLNQGNSRGLGQEGSHGLGQEGSRRLNVVATIPVLAEFARNTGGSLVEVRSIVTGTENPHTYEPRVSDVKALARADLFVRVGLGLEAWAERLLKNSGNPGLVQVVASRRCDVIDSNPHVWMDPGNAKRMITAIMEGLVRADPDHADTYRKNAGRYIERLSALDEEVGRTLLPLSGQAVVTAVPALTYFLRRYGVEEAATIISVPGKEPSARHLRRVILLMRKRGIGMILTVPQFPPDIPGMVAEETGAAVVLLTHMPGTLPGTDTYTDMLKEDARRLISAAGKRGRRK
ncbi:MAG: zinc ABC transporter substrate-binding protein [Nitrospirae bacterium]|nr:zinc ABC transporter substrate-binding protein [Nitrospirota bacterium]